MKKVRRPVRLLTLRAQTKRPLPGDGKRGPRKKSRSEIFCGEKEAQQNEREVTFAKKSRRKRYDACSKVEVFTK